MGIHLSAEDITALENRNEGWIAGLQLAALSMQGQKDTAGFIKSFTGSHLDVGEMEAAEARLQDAERWLETTESKPSGEMAVVDEEAFRSLSSTISFARAFLSLAFGDVASTLKHARQGLASLPEADHFQRASAAALLGAAFWRSGELETACNYMIEGVAEIYKAGNPDFAITGIVGLADIRMTQGRLREAVRLYERTLQATLEHGESLMQGTADLYSGLAMLSIERNDLDTAEQHLHKCEELGAQAGLPDWKYRLAIVQAKFNEIQGNLAGSLNLLQEAEQLYYRSPLPDVSLYPH